ncbi:MAG: hypothetical protein KJS92_04350 [Bacteroidetes bacterium]|nr:hypothetical protein [Bacteroidota bacterium]
MTGRIFGMFCAMGGLLWFSSCEDRVEENPVFSGPEYFAYDSGQVRIYEVDSFIHSSQADSVQYRKILFREFAESWIANNDGSRSLRIERSVSYDTGKTWRMNKVFSVQNRSTHAEWWEDNLRTIVLSYPMREKRIWNGNALNSQAPANFSYGAIRSDYSNGLLKAERGVLVNRQADSNFLYRISEHEWYGKGLGLMYREYVSLIKQPGNRVADGVEVYIRLKGFYP